LSEQRKKRTELNQGLHQFLMSLYMSYTENMNEEDAKKLVLNAIEEQYAYFSQQSLSSSLVQEALTEKITQLKNEIDSADDYDTQMYIAEKVDALEAAMRVFD